jgi:hypothetical protein
MNKVANNINWIEIMDKFAKHKGSIIDFCKENNIKHNQLYNQRKKLKKTQTFHVIDVANVNILENTKAAEQSIKIEIGNVKIFIPTEDKDTLLTLVRELAKLC